MVLAYPVAFWQQKNKDPLSNNRLLLLKGNGTVGSTSIVDSSIYNRSILRFGNTGFPNISAIGKFDQSIYFDGGSLLEVPNSESWAFGTGNFTLESWVRFDNVTGERGILSKFSASLNGFALRLSNANSPAGLRLVLARDGSAEVFQRAWSPSSNTWYFIQAIRNNGVMSLAVDGVMLGSSAMSITNLSQATAPLQIGVNQTVSNSNLLGYLDEIRISNIAEPINLPMTDFLGSNP